MNFFKNLFSENRIIILSKDSVVEKRVSVLKKITTFFLSIWLLFTTAFFVVNNSFTKSLIDKKPLTDRELDEKLEKEIISINAMLNNIIDYLGGVNYYNKFIDLSNSEHIDNEKYLTFQRKVNNGNYLKLASLIRDTNSGLNDLDNLISSRIDGINKIISGSKTMKQKIDNLYEVAYLPKLEQQESIFKIFKSQSNLVKDLSHLNGKVNRLNFMEKTLVKMPIFKPINQYFLTSKFGIRKDPFTKKLKMHNGIDLAGATNSQIVTTADGIVERAGIGTGFGNVVVINHGNDIKTYYGHMKRNLVKVGDKVKKGDAIGIQGNTGRSTGTHLHYQISVDGKNIDPIGFIEIGEKFF